MWPWKLGKTLWSQQLRPKRAPPPPPSEAPCLKSSKFTFFKKPILILSSKALKRRTWPSLRAHCPLLQGAVWAEPLPLLSTSLAEAPERHWHWSPHCQNFRCKMQATTMKTASLAISGLVCVLLWFFSAFELHWSSSQTILSGWILMINLWTARGPCLCLSVCE